MTSSESRDHARLPHFRIQAATGWGLPDWRELWAYRDLFYILALRDVKLRYKQTVLGVAWVILQPLLTALIFTVVFGLLAKLPSSGLPYILFAYGHAALSLFRNHATRQPAQYHQ
jgi:lipopolysaccharide transport system permease protein